MTRLIDADALPIWSYPQVWEEGQGINKCCIAVENAPTIEAIPVEWIEKHIWELLEQGDDFLAGYFAEIISLWRDEEC